MCKTTGLGALAVVVLVGSAARAADAPTGDAGTIKFDGMAGSVMTPDLVTLIVAVPAEAKLTYFDTVTNAKAREVELDFKPAALALQGDTLFASTHGGSTVYALDAKTAKVKRQFDVPDDVLAALACHPAKGLVYASSGSRKVYALDPASGKVTRTDATGTFLAVDPVKGDAVYTGTQPPIADETFLIKAGPDGSIKIIQDVWGARAVMLKYDVTPTGLKFAAAQRNAAVNGSLMRLTPDGQRVTILGGGGWRPPAEGGTGGGYVAAVFATKDLQAMAGQAPHGRDLAFHPVLPLGVVNHQGADLTVFHARSFVVKGKLKAPSGQGHGGELLTFGGKGTKVVFWNADGLQLVPLDLTADDRAALEKAYGTLPPPPEALGFSAGAGKASAPAGDVIAESGFNDAKGINIDKAPGSPYPLGQANREGGRGEPGWETDWPASGLAEFQTEVVHEGDGALRLRGTINYRRRLAKPQVGAFRLEQHVRFPPGGLVTCYVWPKDSGAEGAGPMWKAVDGKFLVLHGDEFGSGSWLDTGIPVKAGTWYQVTLGVDVPKRRWEFAVDGKKFDHKGLGFRGRPESLQEVNYLSESQPGLYVDAVRVLDAGIPKDEPKKKGGP